MGILNGNIPLNNLRFQDDNLPSDTSIEQVTSVASMNPILNHTVETNRRDSTGKVRSLCAQ